MNLIRFEKINPVAKISSDYSLIDTAVANDGSILFLFVERSGDAAVTERFQSGIGIFPRAKMSVPKRFCLVTAAAGSNEITELPELDVTFPNVDIFRDGRVLLVGSRCSWRGENDYDLNGTIVDPRSGRSTRILLGDGISSAQVDASVVSGCRTSMRESAVTSAGGIRDLSPLARPGSHVSRTQVRRSGNIQIRLMT